MPCLLLSALVLRHPSAPLLPLGTPSWVATQLQRLVQDLRLAGSDHPPLHPIFDLTPGHFLLSEPDLPRILCILHTFLEEFAFLEGHHLLIHPLRPAPCQQMEQVVVVLTLLGLSLGQLEWLTALQHLSPLPLDLARSPLLFDSTGPTLSQPLGPIIVDPHVLPA